MHRLWIATLLLTACAHRNSEKDREFDFRIKQLEHISVGQGYMQDIDRCQIDYLLCKDAKKQRNCWEVMEACVIDQYNTYQLLKKKLNH